MYFWVFLEKFKIVDIENLFWLDPRIYRKKDFDSWCINSWPECKVACYSTTISPISIISFLCSGWDFKSICQVWLLRSFRYFWQRQHFVKNYNWQAFSHCAIWLKFALESVQVKDFPAGELSHQSLLKYDETSSIISITLHAENTDWTIFRLNKSPCISKPTHCSKPGHNHTHKSHICSSGASGVDLTAWDCT